MASTLVVSGAASYGSPTIFPNLTLTLVGFFVEMDETQQWLGGILFFATHIDAEQEI
jgi:hypothetical protein